MSAKAACLRVLCAPRNPKEKEGSVGMQVSSGVKRATITATITRADGTVEELGVVAFHESNPIKRAVLRLKQMRGERIEEKDVLTLNGE